MRGSGTSLGISIFELESRMDDLKLKTLEGTLDSAEEPGNQDDGLRTVGPDVSYDGVLGRDKRR